MSKVVRLQDVSSLGAPRRPRVEEQLSLFDFDPVIKLYCFPMQVMHGSVFARGIMSIGPSVVADLREFPYFNLSALTADLAFGIMREQEINYVHVPLDLRPAAGIEQWKMRDSVIHLLRAVVDASDNSWGPFVFLLDDAEEVETLKVLTRGALRERNDWSLQLVT